MHMGVISRSTITLAAVIEFGASLAPPPPPPPPSFSYCSRSVFVFCSVFLPPRGDPCGVTPGGVCIWEGAGEAGNKQKHIVRVRVRFQG